MLFYVSVRLKKLVAVGLLYAITLLLVIPFAPVRTASGAEQSSRQLAIQGSPAAHKPGEVLVRFRPSASANDKDIVAASQGARRKKKLRGASAVETLELATAGDVVSAALQLNLNPAVEFAEPNFIVKSDQLGADDPRLNEQWALSNTGQNGGNYGSDIEATNAWQTTQGSTNTVIAVIDSGIDFSHPDLVNNQWTNPSPTTGDVHGWDFVANAGTIKDEQGHGTAVAGIIAAQGNNGIGTSGVMWRAGLMSLRVLDNTGTGDVAGAVEAIDYAIAHGAHVINLSWGTNGFSIILKEAIERALRRGVVVVCSAGNSGRNLDEGTPSSAYYPASFDSQGLIAVAATNNHDQLLSWSNFGERHVAVAAPGEGILTTQMGGGYWTVTGTSAAAPLVSGVAGLLKSVRPGVNTAQVKKAIVDSARRAVSLEGKTQSRGVIDAGKTLAALPGEDGNRGGPGNPMRVQPGPRYGSGGTGPGGSFNTTPPPVTSGAPGSNLPNLDAMRQLPSTPPTAPNRIQSNQMPICDVDCGGGEPAPGGGADPIAATPRTRPANEVGQSGVDLGSRNYNWGLPLVSLKGRAGLDVNIGLYYNSLVWTKDGNSMTYNADRGFPGPGFQLGFPKVQQRFLNSDTNTYEYLMILPSGARVAMTQQGTSNVYESIDGSYTQLIDYGNGDLLVRTTDGMQYNFGNGGANANNEYLCGLIKDRNGNYILIYYNTYGRPTGVVDTLGRILTFNYDSQNYLTSITQTWNGITHIWAQFNYAMLGIGTNFPGMTVNGPANGSSIPVLTQAFLADGSFYYFGYNSWGQVKKIEHYSTDNHLLEYTEYNLPDNASVAQSDCPRFTERRVWAENWNAGAAAVTTYAVATDGSWTQQTSPDGTIYKEFFATTGWRSGLTTGSEVWSAGVKRKWTTAAWTQDDENLTYQKNPRVIEANTYDGEGNRKRTVIGYTWCSLPADIYEYASDGSTLLRRRHIDYRWEEAFLSRRLIGLPDTVSVYEGSGALASKTLYGYDWDYSRHFSAVGPSMHHDATHYGAGFVFGRGNLTGVGRYNVNDLSQLTWVSLSAYDMAGSLVGSRDGLDRLTTIDYGDNYSDGNNSRNTRAYPTKVTDPDGYYSTAQYNYDMGVVTRTQDPKGAAQSITYDGVGRVDRLTNLVNNAYSRYVYGPTYVQNFTTIQEGAGEAYSVQVMDGAGRVYKSASDNPNSTGLYRGVDVVYDAMGRITRQSNPTEMNGGWQAAGDDSGGWVYTQQTYDWQGRGLITTSPDGTTRENIYGGCGCAGGEVTTARDERGRRRKLTKDVLGRVKQVDELNWDTSVYATTTYTYNARDQITQINQSGQIRTMGYDGHGRLQSRTTPEQGTTAYTYFADDTTQTITDARGATTTFAYNGRQLPTSIAYGVPSGIAATPNVSFGYDAAGNRTSMTDGLGSVSYVYDQLSRITNETRTFTGLGSYALTYAYNLGGELTSVTNPWNAQVGYSYDKTGRLTGVTGSGYAGVSSYASALTYRAFGLKGMSYGNGKQLSINYDNKLRMTRWDVAGVLGSDYGYIWEDTFRPAFAKSRTDSTLDRWYAYDHVGRLHIGRSGAEARAAYGEPFNGQYDGPYSIGIYYDVWGNLTYREGWGGWTRFESATYTNNRRDGMQYDAAGNLLTDNYSTFTYDANGQPATNYHATLGVSLTTGYDGDGLRAKKTTNGATTYYLRSTVLGGQVIAEINGSGSWTRGYVYNGGSLLAVQDSGVYWMHEDPVTKSKRVTNGSGAVVSTIELDPWGGETNRSSNQAFQPKRFTTYERDADNWDEAGARNYHAWWSRFAQPDPYDGSYNLTDPQSFNRYTYVQNDPVNFVDPTGLQRNDCTAEFNATGVCTVTGGGGPRPIDDPGLFLFVRNSRFGGYPGGNRVGVGGDPRTPQPDPQPTPENPTPTIMQRICSAIPSGRTTGASGTLGLLGGPTGGVELVRNYNSGQVSAFAFGGGQVGWNGGASGSLYAGNVYGLNNSSSNYAGGFRGVNGSGRVVGGFVSRGGGVTAVGASANASLVGPINFGLTRTEYTNPLQLGKFWAFDERDFAFFLTRQVVCR